MKKGIVLGFSTAIVVVVLLLAGSSLGAYVRAQVEEREAGAITCGDSVSCSRTNWVMRVINTGTGHGILGKTASTKTTKAAVIGNATKKARGVYGKSNEGVGVFGESTSTHGIKGVTSSSSSTKAGVYGKNSTSGNYGYIGSSANGVFGYSSNNNGVHGESSSGAGVRGHGDTRYGVYGTTYTGSAVSGESSGSGAGVYGDSSSGWAGHFGGKVLIDGRLHLYSQMEASIPSEGCVIWLDWGTGDLKVKFSNGTTKTLAED